MYTIMALNTSNLAYIVTQKDSPIWRAFLIDSVSRLKKDPFCGPKPTDGAGGQ